MGRTVTCGHCGFTFEPGWTEEEALAEMEEHFGPVAEEERVAVCDRCYHEMRLWEAAKAGQTVNEVQGFLRQREEQA